MSNLYATPADVIARIPAAAGSEALLLPLLALASREVDIRTRRAFYVVSESRDFDALDTSTALLNDLLTLTSLKTDDDKDYTYGVTWATTDYLLAPWNTYPKTRLSVAPDGNYDFDPSHQRSVRIVGTWGYGDGRRAAPWDDNAGTITLADATTTAAVISSAGIVAQGATYLIDGSEQVYVESTAGTAAVVTRGVNGTTAAAHTTATIKRAAYPLMVKEAVIYIARELYLSAPGEQYAGEVIGEYEYTRANLTTITTREQAILSRFLDPFTRVAL